MNYHQNISSRFADKFFLYLKFYCYIELKIFKFLTCYIFFKVQDCGILDNIMSWVKFKTEAQLNKKTYATKHSRLRGIPKLDDANNAGTKNSRDCTLIVTEGDSAKALAMAGLGVVGRDKYGVFPLRGKLLNVRDATHKSVCIYTKCPQFY